MTATSKKTPPWKKPKPAGAKHTKLTTAQKTTARAAAKKAGRKYPNLIDNMRVAKKR